MSTLDNAFLIGKETTYGTAAALTRGYEAQDDNFKRNQEYIESRGFRAGQVGLRHDRISVVNMGGEGEVMVDVLTSGMGLLWEAAFGATSEITTPADATLARAWSHTVTKDGPNTSVTAQMIRTYPDTSSQAFTYLGCRATGWEFMCDVGGHLSTKVMFDVRDSNTTVAAGTPTYPEGTPVPWTQGGIEIAGGSVDFSKFNLKCEYGMNVDRRHLRNNGLKKAPVVQQLTSIEGEFTGHFESIAHYNRFVSGETVTAAITFVGALIETGQNYSLTFTIPSLQYRGETPKASPSELTEQTIPFRVLDTGSAPMLTLSVVSTDTSL